MEQFWVELVPSKKDISQISDIQQDFGTTQSETRLFGEMNIRLIWESSTHSCDDST
jgi:hypothetical protein